MLQLGSRPRHVLSGRGASSTAVCARPPAPHFAAAHPGFPARRCGLVVSQAKRRELDRDYSFLEIYQVVVEKLRERNCLLVRDTYQLIECIKTPEQAARCLDIIQAYIKAQTALQEAPDDLDPLPQGQPVAGPVPAPSPAAALELGVFASDWHHRKRFLSRIAEIAVLELKKPEVVFAIIGNMQRFKISTYFGKDLIKQLGAHSNVPLDVLARIASLVQQQRGTTDKGTRAAMAALLEVMEDRGTGAETIASVKSTLAPPAPTKSAVAPAPAPPANVVAV